jgi:hypothetical protein
VYAWLGGDLVRSRPLAQSMVHVLPTRTLLQVLTFMLSLKRGSRTIGLHAHDGSCSTTEKGHVSALCCVAAGEVTPFHSN